MGLKLELSREKDICFWESSTYSKYIEDISLDTIIGVGRVDVHFPD